VAGGAVQYGSAEFLAPQLERLIGDAVRSVKRSPRPAHQPVHTAHEMEQKTLNGIGV